ncbi:unnamed protein product, partial [Prorocentrum cordatum]
ESSPGQPVDLGGDVGGEALEAVLHFLHTDHFDPVSPPSRVLDMSDAEALRLARLTLEVHSLADRFCLPRLGRLCEVFLSDFALRPAIVVPILASVASLRRACMGKPGGRVLGLPGAELGRDRGPPQLRAAGAGDAGPPPRPGAPPGRQRRPARRAPGRGRRRHRASRSVTARGQIHRNLQWHVGRPRGRHRARWRRGRRTASYIILSSSSSSSSSSSCSHHWGGQVVWPRKTQARPAHNVQIVSDARHPRHYSPRSSASPAQARRQLSGHPGQK